MTLLAIGLVFLGLFVLTFFAYGLWDRRQRRGVKSRGRYVDRVINGKLTKIQVDDGPYGDFMADVIARTVESGKPQFGTYEDGKVTIEELNDEETHS